MNVKIPALAASALLAGSIVAHADAATARIFPVRDGAGAGSTTMNVGFNADDDCRFRIAADVVEAMPGGRAAPRWRSPVVTMNACAGGTLYEDGSILDPIVVRFPTSELRRGRSVLRVAIMTRRWGGAWHVHAYVRTFWH